ncbi:MAG: hypothetical protein OES24_02180 [Acidimicrobiia bacterium]|nr:hypothetical protein [Acidimicrobiia bacterium]
MTTDLSGVADAVGSAVVAHDRLVGGAASTVIRCRFADRTEPLVLRVIDDRALLRREPDIIDREAEALRILGGTPLTAPTLVAADC